MNAGNKLEGIYVDLDVLLDTRIGTLAKHDDSVAQAVLTDKYYQRTDDYFDGIDRELYLDLYKKRDVETLSLSCVTNAIQLLDHLSKTLNEQAITRPYHDGVQFFVNIYPYSLVNVEIDAIQKAICVWLGNASLVEIINIPPVDLTPSYCKSLFSMMLMYEYEEWMELQTKAFEKTQIPEITLFVPALYFNKTPTDEEIEVAAKDGAHPQMALEMLASPLVELRLIDVKYFSIIEKQ